VVNLVVLVLAVLIGVAVALVQLERLRTKEVTGNEFNESTEAQGRSHGM